MITNLCTTSDDLANYVVLIERQIKFGELKRKTSLVLFLLIRREAKGTTSLMLVNYDLIIFYLFLNKGINHKSSKSLLISITNPIKWTL